jgi:hypothetical protein
MNADPPSYMPPSLPSPGSYPTSSQGSSGFGAEDESHDTLLSPPPPSSALPFSGSPEPPTLDLPALDVHEFDLPTPEIPRFDAPTLELEPLTLEEPRLAMPVLEVPAPTSRIAQGPSLETPAQRPPNEPTLPPEPASTIPSPQPPPSSRESLSPEGPRPTLLEITSALDRGAFDEALRLCRYAEASPELSLLKARVHARAGELEETELELRRLLRAPLLEPSLRAATARLLIELGFPTRALEQARHAVEDDPKDPLARVICAWALVRVDQRVLDPALSEQAEPLLSALRLRDPTLSALLPALRAPDRRALGERARVAQAGPGAGRGAGDA